MLLIGLKIWHVARNIVNDALQIERFISVDLVRFLRFRSMSTVCSVVENTDFIFVYAYYCLLTKYF